MKNKNIPPALMRTVKKGLQHIESAYRYNTRNLVHKGQYTETALADLKVGKVVTRTLQAVFPDAALLVEESAPAKVDLQKYQFVIDPIDSTRGLLFNLPGTGCAIAYLEKGEPVYSCIGQITASSGKDCFLHDVVYGSVSPRQCFAGKEPARRYKASARTAPRDYIVCVEMDAFDVARENFGDGFRIAEELMPPKGASRAIRMFGSSSFGFVAVCRGSLDIFTGSRKPWDYLPGIPLVIGSGGSYFFYEDTCGVIRICAAGNAASLHYAKQMHERAGMKILQKHPLKFVVEASI